METTASRLIVWREWNSSRSNNRSRQTEEEEAINEDGEDGPPPKKRVKQHPTARTTSAAAAAAESSSSKTNLGDDDENAPSSAKKEDKKKAAAAVPQSQHQRQLPLELQSVDFSQRVSWGKYAPYTDVPLRLTADTADDEDTTAGGGGGAEQPHAHGADHKTEPQPKQSNPASPLRRALRPFAFACTPCRDAPAPVPCTCNRSPDNTAIIDPSRLPCSCPSGPRGASRGWRWKN